MNHDNIRQFKLSSGEEVMCEVLEEHEEEIIARLVLRIAKYEISINQTYYSFKPWLAYQDNVEENILLSKYHIMGMGEPAQELLEQYIAYYEASLSELDSDSVQKDFVNALREKNPHLSDSDFSNVISFTFGGKTKIH